MCNKHFLQLLNIFFNLMNQIWYHHIYIYIYICIVIFLSSLKMKHMNIISFSFIKQILMTCVTCKTLYAHNMHTFVKGFVQANLCNLDTYVFNLQIQSNLCIEVNGQKGSKLIIGSCWKYQDFINSKSVHDYNNYIFSFFGGQFSPFCGKRAQQHG